MNSASIRMRNVISPPFFWLCSMNHLVRAQQELLRYRNLESLRGLQIDHEVEFRRLFDRQVRRLRAFENLVDEDRGPSEVCPDIRPVRHEGRGLGELALREDSWQSVFLREFFDA